MSYLIGVDGGGTKTECILIDAAGRMVAGHVGVGCNPSIVGLESAASIVTAALHSLRAQAATHFAQAHGRAADPATLVTRTLLCMAGHRDFWRELAAGLTGFGRVATSDDSLPVLELATAGRPGLVLHAGTGSFVAARAPGGAIHFAGGLGWRFGDPGSGYDLGWRAISRGLLELQGWAPPTRLGAAVRAHSQLGEHADAGAVTRHYYQQAEPNRHIAALAPIVLQLAGAGDELQGIKKGILELADILAVNKADGDNRARAEAARCEFSRALHYLSGPEGAWPQHVLACSAVTGEGIAEVWAMVEKFFAHGKRSGAFTDRRREQTLAWLDALVGEGLREAYASRRGVTALRAQLESQVGAGLVPAPVAARQLLTAAGFDL